MCDTTKCSNTIVTTTPSLGSYLSTATKAWNEVAIDADKIYINGVDINDIYVRKDECPLAGAGLFAESEPAPKKDENGKFGGLWYENGEEIYITKVICNPPAYIVFWSDGSKTVATCSTDEMAFDSEKALLVCVMKRMMGGEWTHKLLSDWSVEFGWNENEREFVGNSRTLSDVRKLHRAIDKKKKK